MRENVLKKRLKQGEKVMGTWSMSASPIVVNAIAEAGLDFVIIDMEHGPMGFETMGNMVMAAECAGSQAIIRVSDASEQTILRALETGCQGIMVPHVATAHEAASVVRACKYAPEGERGLSPYTRNHGYSHQDLANSLKRANDNTLVGILVEGKKGIANLGEIAAVPGLDLIYLGVYDISQSVGRPGELNHPEVIAAQKHCVTVIHEHGLAAGSFARDPEYLRFLVDNGFEFLAYLVDCAMLRSGYEAVRSRFPELHRA